MWIPVMCLRWAHSGIHSLMRFDKGSCIWQGLVMELWTKRFQWSVDVPTMDVVLDDSGNLWSLGNRRLAAFRVLQALNATTVWVHVHVCGPDHGKFKSAKTTRNEGMGIEPNR